MKRLKKFFSAAVLGIAVGCSTLTVKDAEVYLGAIEQVSRRNRYFSLENVVRENGKLYAGASAIEITPYTNQYMAGFAPNRLSDGISDELFARSVVISKDSRTVALCSLDLIGFPNENVLDVREIIRRIPGNYVDEVMIASTHTHSGPDTLGIWGGGIWKIPFSSGIDREYMVFIYDKIAESVYRAARDIKEAKLVFGSSQVGPNDHISQNRRIPNLIDRELAVLQFRDLNDRAIATVSNYACHPEALQSTTTLLSPDFVGEFNYQVERKYGGTSIFFNQALGGMVTPHRIPGRGRMDELARIGTFLARKVDEALSNPIGSRSDAVAVYRSEFLAPVENSMFRFANSAGYTRRRDFDGSVRTEMTRIDIGDAQILTVPGELLPKLGFEIKKQMRGRSNFIISLGNDELGYILAPEDYDAELYSYESSMSIGRKIGELVRSNASNLIQRR